MNDAPKRLRPLSLGSIVLGVMLGVSLVLAGLVVLLLLRTRDRAPPLSAKSLEVAAKRWKAEGLADYDLEVLISGGQSGRYQVQVRNGRPKSVKRNGVAPRRGTWDSWTVPGLLGVIRRELELSADPVRGFNAPPGAEVVLRAQFDPKWGYPRRYQRSILDTSRAATEIEWQITTFVPDPGRKNGNPPAAAVD